MIVGIIADTNDRLLLREQAVKRLNEEKVELVLHAGDNVAPFVVPHFNPSKDNLMRVFDNSDGDQILLKKQFMELEVEVLRKLAEVKVEGSRIPVLHGNEAALLSSLIDVACYDVIVHAPAHKAKICRKRKTNHSHTVHSNVSHKAN